MGSQFPPCDTCCNYLSNPGQEKGECHIDPLILPPEVEPLKLTAQPKSGPGSTRLFSIDLSAFEDMEGKGKEKAYAVEEGEIEARNTYFSLD